MIGKSGKQYFNPKVMEHHGDMPDEGHPMIHHVEIHPHGGSSMDPHHVEIHMHDGEMKHGGEHGSYDEAAEAGKQHIDGVGEDMEHGESAREEAEEGIHAVKNADNGAM